MTDHSRKPGIRQTSIQQSLKPSRRSQKIFYCFNRHVFSVLFLNSQALGYP